MFSPLVSLVFFCLSRLSLLFAKGNENLNPDEGGCSSFASDFLDPKLNAGTEGALVEPNVKVGFFSSFSSDSCLPKVNAEDVEALPNVKEGLDAGFVSPLLVLNPPNMGFCVSAAFDAFSVLPKAEENPVVSTGLVDPKVKDGIFLVSSVLLAVEPETPNVKDDLSELLSLDTPNGGS